MKHRPAGRLAGGTAASWVLGITGTPGTGKKSVAAILADELGMMLLEINSLARPRSGQREGKEIEVDTRKLRRELSRRRLRGTIVSGHLLADVLPPSMASFVVVLRCEPRTLKRRLSARGYPPEKIMENVEAELIGVVLDGAVRSFGAAKVHEYDSTRAEPARLARRIASDYREGRVRSGPWIDWTLNYDSPTRLTSLLSSPRTVPAST